MLYLLALVLLFDNQSRSVNPTFRQFGITRWDDLSSLLHCIRYLWFYLIGVRWWWFWSSSFFFLFFCQTSVWNFLWCTVARTDKLYWCKSVSQGVHVLITFIIICSPTANLCWWWSEVDPSRLVQVDFVVVLCYPFILSVSCPAAWHYCTGIFPYLI